LDNFKPKPEHGIFKSISSLNGSFLRGDGRGFFCDRGSRDQSNGTNVAS
jgi:hypothetical protein